MASLDHSYLQYPAYQLQHSFRRRSRGRWSVPLLGLVAMSFYILFFRYVHWRNYYKYRECLQKFDAWRLGLEIWKILLPICGCRSISCTWVIFQRAVLSPYRLSTLTCCKKSSAGNTIFIFFFFFNQEHFFMKHFPDSFTLKWHPEKTDLMWCLISGVWKIRRIGDNR